MLRVRIIAEKCDEYVQERLSEIESSNGEDLTKENLTHNEENEIYSKVRSQTFVLLLICLRLNLCVYMVV